MDLPLGYIANVVLVNIPALVHVGKLKSVGWWVKWVIYQQEHVRRRRAGGEGGGALRVSVVRVSYYDPVLDKVSPALRLSVEAVLVVRLCSCMADDGEDVAVDGKLVVWCTAAKFTNFLD